MIGNAASRGRVRALVRKEMRQLLRDPKTKRIVFAAPVIQLLLFGYAVTTDVRDVNMFVVDHDRTAESRALQDAFTAGGWFSITGRSDRSGDIGTALDAGDAGIGLEIPAGFARDLASGRGASVQVLVDGTSSNTATVAQGYATRIVQEFGASYAVARGHGIDGGVDLRARAWFNPDLTSRVYNVPAIIGVLLMMMSLLLTALGVVRERELGTLDQLLVSPLGAGELILGKTIPVAIIALIDLALICAFALLWFGIPLRGSVPALVVASFVFILASLGLGLFISTVSKTQQEAFMGMFLLFLPVVILSGFMYPIDTMPPFFQSLTLLNPLRHFLEIVREKVLQPMALHNIVLAPTADETARIAHLQGPANEGTPYESYNSDWWRETAIPWGGFYGSALDMMRFTASFLPGRQNVLSDSSREAMTQDQVHGLEGGVESMRTIWNPGFWACGWEMKGSKPKHWTGNLSSPNTWDHWGFAGTLAWADPDRELAVTMFANRSVSSMWMFRPTRWADLCDDLCKEADKKS